MSKRSVVAEIQRRISAGSLPPGRRLPSERELASEFGVSRAAVQSALRELESLGLLLRQPNCRPIVLPTRTKASSLGVQVADQIGIWILPDMQDLGGSMMLQGIRSAFGSENYRLLIGCPPSYEREVIERAEIDFLRSLRENPNIAGAIIWDTGNPGSRNAYRSLVEAGVPLVFIDREPPFEIAADVVATNNRRAARNAVRHLIGLGHQRIAMVLGEDRASSVLDRIEGYRAALAQAEVNFKPNWLVDLPTSAESRAVRVAEKVLLAILAGSEPPTALFAVNDRIALYLLEAAKNLRIRVPERFSLIGFDWLMRWLPSGGDLTTVSQPFDEIGRTAAQRLLGRIGSTATETPRLILLDAPLVIRNSTGAPFTAPTPGRKTQFTGESYAQTPTSVHSH